MAQIYRNAASEAYRASLQKFLKVAFELDKAREALLWEPDQAGNYTCRILGDKELKELEYLNECTHQLLQQARAEGILSHQLSQTEPTLEKVLIP